MGPRFRQRTRRQMATMGSTTGRRRWLARSEVLRVSTELAVPSPYPTPVIQDILPLVTPTTICKPRSYGLRPLPEARFLVRTTEPQWDPLREVMCPHYIWIRAATWRLVSSGTGVPAIKL